MLRISLLGEQVIEDDATGEIRSRSSRSLALVGYLALHAGTPQSRQVIAGVLWPDSSDAQSLTNLRRELHHLRRVLGEDGSLQATSMDLCWRDTDTCRVDLRVLRTRLEQARRPDGDAAAVAEPAAEGIAAYRGDFLPAVYDEWAVDARDQLRRECVDLCDLLTVTGTDGGDPASALAAARRRVVLAPLEEVGYRSLMRLQLRLGDRGGAISTYHHCASVLERELGVAPDPQTRKLLEQLIGSSETSAGDRTEPGEPVTRAAASVPLVGRSAPLGRLRHGWEATVREERPRLVVVRGFAGVGKSRLVAELADQVRRTGGVVAASQCFDTSGRLVLAPVADWLRTPELRTAAQGLDPVWRAEVDRLVPDPSGEPAAPTTGDRAMVDAWQRHRFFEGLARACLAVRRPLLVVLDNLQWCDQETLSWISFLLGFAPDARLMVAATLREEESGPVPSAAADWLSGLRTGRLVEELALAPLEPQHTAALSAAVTGSRVSGPDSELLQETTGGFPLYVIEAARIAGGPDEASGPSEELGAVLRRRVAETSPAAQETAGLAAALGRDFTLDVLTEASDLDLETVARAVDELWRRRLVRELGSGYAFSHDLLRDAAYDLVGPPRRWLLHRRLAQALELTSEGREDDVAALLAEQYERAGQPERAAVHYARAAEVAAARYAATESIRLRRRALDIIRAGPPGRRRDLHELDCLLSMAAPLNASQGYASRELTTVLERAVALADSTGSRDKLVKGLLGLWASRYVEGNILESLRVATRALAVSEADDVLLGEAHFAFAGSSAGLGRPAQAVEHFDVAHDRVRGAESLAVGSMPDVHALAWAAHAHWLLGQWQEAADRAAQAVARARSGAHPYSLAVALAYAALTYQLLGEEEALSDATEELAALSSRYGFAYYGEWGLILSGWQQGGTEGVQAIRKGIDNLRNQRSMARMPYWLSLLADALVGTGHPEDAVATLDAAQTLAGARGDAWWLPEILRMRAAYADGPGGHRAELLRSAYRLARRQGSSALADRARDDVQADARGTLAER
jgi:DNA-binding SARP family transcriptional activator/tetratricopeptide (TPR) repeat protein